MSKKEPKLAGPRREKNIVNRFFRVHTKVIARLLRMHRASTIGLLGLSLVLLSAEYIELKMLEYTTNSVSAYMYGNLSDFRYIALSVSIFLIALLVIRILSWVYNKMLQKYQNNISAKIEKNMVTKLASVKYEYFESNAFYEKMNLAKQASEQYPTAVQSISQFVNIAIKTVVYGWMLSRLSFLYVVVLLFSIFLCSIISAKITDKQLAYWTSNVSPESRRKAYFGGVFAGQVNQQNIQIAGSFPYFSKKFGYYINRERKNYIKLNLLSMLTELATSILFIITFFSTAILVGRGVASGTYEIGYFTMVVAMLSNLFVSIKSYVMLIMNRSWYVKTLDAYEEILNYNENAFGSIANDTNDAVFIKELKYKYMQTEVYAIKGINVNLKMGEKIVLVGENGSGKTTLVSVILGLLDNYEGIYRCGLLSFAALLQDFGQYQMTIKENLQIGRGGDELSDKEAIEILTQVGLYDSISSLPNGIYTQLGQLEKGIELSKGQWQRLAIGRLLAKTDANVWILDEPTAYLDPIAEIELYNMVYNLSGDRLVIFISHRLGFCKNADRIIVIKDGIIAEQGTHSDLMNIDNGYYASMYAAQKEWYE